MYLVHESTDGRRHVLASDVETADSLVAKTRGLMFRETVPEDYALVFPFEPGALELLADRFPSPLKGFRSLARRRSIHMAFVRVPLDVLWLDDGEVVEVRTLRPWRDADGAPADTVVELAGGAATDVEPGDRVYLADSLADGAVRDWRHTGRRHRYRTTGTGTSSRRRQALGLATDGSRTARYRDR